MFRRCVLLVFTQMAFIGLHPNATGPSARFPLAISDDHLHLQDSSGAPFLVLGDTAWSLLAR